MTFSYFIPTRKKEFNLKETSYMIISTWQFFYLRLNGICLTVQNKAYAANGSHEVVAHAASIIR